MNPLLRKYISRNVRINNGDTLGHVELIVWLEQCYQGDQREQDDQGEVSIIIFRMSESSGFQKMLHLLAVSGIWSVSLSLSSSLSLSLFLYLCSTYRLGPPGRMGRVKMKKKRGE